MTQIENFSYWAPRRPQLRNGWFIEIDLTLYNLMTNGLKIDIGGNIKGWHLFYQNFVTVLIFFLQR